MKNDERPIKFTYMQRNQEMFFGINNFYKHWGLIWILSQTAFSLIELSSVFGNFAAVKRWLRLTNI